MRKLSLWVLLLCSAAMFTTTGCGDKKAGADDSTFVDSTMMDSIPSDTLETLLEEMPMPKAADELFDDFIFNFAANKNLQRERTDFPLTLVSYGKTQMVEKKKWVIDRFFMRQGYYTLIFNSRKQMRLGNDTSLTQVKVEKILYDKEQLRTWQFNRVNGQWRLQKMTYEPLGNHSDAQFLKFYQSFATDTTFQTNAIADEFDVSTPDPDDDFSRMEGTVLAEQWPAFAPWMPSGEIYNIHYGSKPYKNTNERIFVIRGIANGMETELTFRKDGEAWKLVKMEN